MLGSRSALARGFLIALFLPALAHAQVPAAPVLNPAAVNGSSVTVTWNAVPGAVSYRIEAAVTPGPPQAAYELGPTTGFTLPAPPGTYYLRVFARGLSGLSAPSNVITVVVGAAPPAPPQNLQAAVNGSSVTFSVQLPAGPLAALAMAVGRAPGATDSVVPLPVGTSATVNGVPAGVYYARLYAINAAGPSAPSNEVQVVVGGVGCSPPAAPALTVQASGSVVALAWTAVPGAAGYRLDVSTSPGGSPFLSQPYGPQTTGVTAAGVTPGTYFARLTVATACGQATSAEAAISVAAPPPGTNRTPNPPPGQRLPLPNRESVVAEMGRLYPGDLRNSCVEHGGNNVWLYRLVQRLRQEDTRWGLNWKRGRVGDMSQDVVTYNYGSQADEGTTEVYIIDVIVGHCGGSPGAAFIDQTEATRLGGTIGRWTLQPYTAAGLR